MKYMLLMYSDESVWTDEERSACRAESAQICHDLAAKGQYIDAAPLHSVTTATSLRIRDGKRLITDGPFAETTEQLGGFFLIDVDNLDEALAIASRLPQVRNGKSTVEVRPLFELGGMPTPRREVSSSNSN